jgi:hypothetical protein
MLCPIHNFSVPSYFPSKTPLTLNIFTFYFQFLTIRKKPPSKLKQMFQQMFTLNASFCATMTICTNH